jgi:hypothetical protein
MGFELPALPSFQTNIPQMPSALDQYGKMLQLKSLMGSQQMQQQQIQQQQQMAPLQVQQAQEGVKQAQLQTQEMQLKQDSQKAIQQAMVSGVFSKYVGADTGNGSGIDANGLLKELSSNPKILPEQAGQIVDGFLKRYQTMAETAKAVAQTGGEQATIRGKGFDALHERVADVLSLSGDKQTAALSSLTQDLANNPQLFAGVPKDDLGHVFVAARSGDLDTLKIQGGALAVDKKMAETAKAQAEAAKAQLGIAPPTPDQLTTFTGKTLPAFAALRPEQKQAFTAEAQSARTVDELNKVTERADATDKAEQMHRDSLAQTEALKGQTFAQQGLKENDKTWTDPQHGYVSTLAQANLGKKAIQAGADGNGLLTSLEPTMAVLGMNSFAGTHRISPAEASAAGAPGGWAERFTAWADKSASGKISPQLAKEGNQLFDQLVDSKYASSVQSSAMHAKGFGIPPANLPVMDRDGNLTTLDKVKLKPGSETTAPPAGATHVGVGSLDKKKHYLDASGKDLGVAE